MKIEHISDHIWTLKSWMFFECRVWIVANQEGSGVTLVDAGIGRMAKDILAFVKKLDKGPIQQILLTHGHSDHVGSVLKIVESTKAPVYAHPIEIPYLEGDLPYPRRKKAEQTLPKDVVRPFYIEEDGQLPSFGALQTYLAPGHSPGHVVYFHEQDQVLLAGDLFTSKKGKLTRPMKMFTGNMHEAVQSSRIVEKLKPVRLEVCHSGPVFDPAKQISSYIEEWSSLQKN